MKRLKATLFIIFSFVLLCLSGCDFFDENVESKEPDGGDMEVTAQNSQTPTPFVQIHKTYELRIIASDIELQKYEPESGCYSGAYIVTDKRIDGKIKQFEKLTDTSNAIYAYVMTAGEPLPAAWYLECVASMKTPMIVINPSDKYAPFDISLLTKTAEDIAQFNLPVFIRLYPYAKSNNYKADEYINFYRQAKTVFDELAPNAAIVWSVYFEDVYDCDAFYPGDDYVDWVGIDAFANVSTMGEYKDIMQYIDFFYYKYQRAKPIMVSELGISHFTTENHSYHTSKAGAEIAAVYERLRNDYPRLKAIVYMNCAESETRTGMSLNDFTITNEDLLLEAYKNAVSEPGFLPSVQENAVVTGEVMIKSPFLAAERNSTYYVPYRALLYDFKMSGLELFEGSEVIIDGEKYHSLKLLSEYKNIDFTVNDETGIMLILYKGSLY